MYKISFFKRKSILGRFPEVIRSFKRAFALLFFVLFLIFPSFADNTPRLGFGELSEGQALKFITYNEMLKKMDAYVQCIVACASQTVPLTTSAIQKGDFYVGVDGRSIGSVSGTFDNVSVGNIVGFSGFTYSATNDVSFVVSGKIADTTIQTTRSLQAEALDYSATVTMTSPSEGDLYIVAGGGNGAWYGKDGRIAQYYNGAWSFTVPQEGWTAWDACSSKMLFYKQGEWHDPLIAISNLAAASAAITQATVNYLFVANWLDMFEKDIKNVDDAEIWRLSTNDIWPYYFGSYVDVYCPLNFNNGKGIWGAGYAQIDSVTAEVSLRIPLITTAARDLIPNPTGQVIFNTDRNFLQIYGATQWLEIQTNSAP